MGQRMSYLGLSSFFTILTASGFVTCVQGAIPLGTEAQVGGSTVHGVRCEHTASNAFLGNRYGPPPMGDLRFAQPKPNNYSTSIDATKWTPHCLQFGVANIVPGAQSEDW